MTVWHEKALGDVLTLQRGFDLPARERVDGPYPIVSSSGVTGRHAFAKAEPPGVVIGRYGSLGSVHWVTEPYWPLNTSLWVKDFKGNDPRYLSYLLRTIRADGSAASAVPGVNRNHLHLLPVRVPDVPEQRRIAAILSSFDQLIEINERRIEILEELARSVYREWFVRYRFPHHEVSQFVESQHRQIPAGWQLGRVDDVAGVVIEGVEPRDVAIDDPYVGLEHLPRRSTTLVDWADIGTVTSRKLRFRRGDTLFGKIRPYFHKVAWAPFDGVASSDTIVIRPHGKLTGLVNTMLSSDAMVAEVVATSNGTKMPRADPDALMRHTLVLPPLDGELMTSFESAARAWLELAACLASQNRMLAATRDLLLPRLVTGRLDISDIDLGDLLEPEAA